MSAITSPLAAAAHGLDEAVTGAQIALSAYTAGVACDVTLSAAPALTSQRIYIDPHTSTPTLKRDRAAIVELTGALFTDIALVASAPVFGIHTPALAVSSSADQFQAARGPLGMSSRPEAPKAEVETTRKRLPSVIVKGWAMAEELLRKLSVEP